MVLIVKKSKTTILLDMLRHVLILAVTLWSVSWVWHLHWLIGLIALIPIYLVALNLIGFATLPLYALRPEAADYRKVMQEFREGNLESARAAQTDFIKKYSASVEGPSKDEEAELTELTYKTIRDDSLTNYAFMKVSRLSQNTNIFYRIYLFRMFSFDLGYEQFFGAELKDKIISHCLERLAHDLGKEQRIVAKNYVTYCNYFYSLMKKAYDEPDQMIEVGHYLAELIYKGETLYTTYVKMIEEIGAEIEGIDEGVVSTLDGMALIGQSNRIRQLCKNLASTLGGSQLT